MNKSPRVVQEICKKHDINEYLDNKGLVAQGFNNNRTRYYCPFHGPETEPSFYVFDKGEQQDYFCFGCRAAGNFIHLYAHYNSLSLKKAVYELSQELELDFSYTQLEDYLDDIEEVLRNTTSGRDTVFDVGEMSFRLSKNFYEYLRMCNFNREEVKFVENICQRVDVAVQSMDVDLMQQLYDTITDKLNERIKQQKRGKSNV